MPIQFAHEAILFHPGNSAWMSGKDYTDFFRDRANRTKETAKNFLAVHVAGPVKSQNSIGFGRDAVRKGHLACPSDMAQQCIDHRVSDEVDFRFRHTFSSQVLAC